MFRTKLFGTQWAFALAVAGCLALFAVPIPRETKAAETLDGTTTLPPIQKIEEDWELVLNEPGSELLAPQFHTVMSPFPHTDRIFVQTSWNYREYPDFLPGGLQMRGWDGEFDIGLKSVGELPLSTSSETVTWTQALELWNGKLVYAVSNGQSSSWGYFGGDIMKLFMDRSLSQLNDYTPEVSVKNSCVTYGTNRVNLLVMKEVRYYDSAGNVVKKDTTRRVVYQLTTDY